MAPLNDEQIAALLAQVPRWRVAAVETGDQIVKSLQRTFHFKDFRAAMAFLREVEEIAESEGHHPDFCVHYSRVDFTIWTHAIGGLHENDFILASKIDALPQPA
ncbi:4a-hydroxytetrahydrobiopterin dehydratase [candidate division GN15 bacterium]|uniref:Putative pterin-4-alpha-carbinolamine dehydratase n=1 Tax=candidate division GN15 bacterium TaxID=2072418 RepID=A0A855X479_9BACT|nr:MAG: 4a-hydroxytetrahydrobiopterin dehydratase [candidate division GN15 bacterium]